MSREEQAATLKEGIYLIFSALAVVLAIRGHGQVTAGEALITLAVTLAGTVSAVFTADVLAHVVSHGRHMTAAEFRHAVRSSFGALSAVALPFIFLGISAATGWEVTAALLASAVSLALALAAIAWAAAHRVEMRWWQRLIVLVAETVLALAVIGLQLLAHA